MQHKKLALSWPKKRYLPRYYSAEQIFIRPKFLQIKI